MHGRSHRLQASVATVALVAIFALGVTPTALGDAGPSASQPSAIERLLRQEDARRKELAKYDAVARQNEVSRMLDAREQALHPFTTTAPTSASTFGRASAGDGGFAWGAAAVGLGAGIAAMLALLGCVALARSTRRPQSV